MRVFTGSPGTMMLCFWLGINEETCDSRHAGSHRWPRLMILRQVEQPGAGRGGVGGVNLVLRDTPKPLISLTWSQHSLWTFQLHEPISDYL